VQPYVRSIEVYVHSYKPPHSRTGTPQKIRCPNAINRSFVKCPLLQQTREIIVRCFYARCNPAAFDAHHVRIVHAVSDCVVTIAAVMSSSLKTRAALLRFFHLVKPFTRFDLPAKHTDQHTHILSLVSIQPLVLQRHSFLLNGALSFPMA